MQTISSKVTGNRIFKSITWANAVLLIPFTASMVSNEVNWSVFDYIVASMLLTGFALFIELGLRYTQRGVWRLLSILFILLVFVLLYVELAVGLFGSPFAGS